MPVYAKFEFLLPLIDCFLHSIPVKQTTRNRPTSADCHIRLSPKPRPSRILSVCPALAETGEPALADGHTTLLFQERRSRRCAVQKQNGPRSLWGRLSFCCLDQRPIPRQNPQHPCQQLRRQSLRLATAPSRHPPR
jgi:hypothetical protein